VRRDVDVTDTVRAMLDAAGYDPPPDEVAELEREYLMHRNMIALLHAVEPARYESPALIFDPDPRFAEWSAP
jgi:hypothetical protein